MMLSKFDNLYMIIYINIDAEILIVAEFLYSSKNII